MKSGILVVDKPKGMTSFDVCRVVRRVFNTKKVGHTGTLDPDATGVLPVCVNQATRLAQYLTETRKVYEAKLVFGFATDSQDVSGTVVAEGAKPNLTRHDFDMVVEKFHGDILQKVNPYSAIKVKGRPLYDYARKGDPIPNLPDRKATIYDLGVLAYTPDYAELRAVVSPGTYIRTLVHDIGKAAGSLACMEDLRRLESGGFGLEASVTLEALEKADTPEAFLLPMISGLNHMTLYDLERHQAHDVMQGRQIMLGEEKGGGLVGVCFDNALLAIGDQDGLRFQPRKVFQLEGDV